MNKFDGVFASEDEQQLALDFDAQDEIPAKPDNYGEGQDNDD